MGGEPLCQENIFLSNLIIKSIKERLPQVKVYVWTGYVYEELLHNNNKHIQMLLDATDVLIDGPYVEGMEEFRSRSNR